jgi:hypothetical protein
VVTNPVTGVKHSGWTPVLLTNLAELGVKPDFLIYHRYPMWQGLECDFLVLQLGSGFVSDIENLRMQLTDYMGPTSSSVQIFNTENNSQAGVEGKQMCSIVNGLYMADSFGTAVQTECDAFLWWDLINGQTTSGNNGSWLYGWREYGDEGVMSPSPAFAPYPTLYAHKLIGKFASPGDSTIAVKSSSGLLTVYGTKRSDGSIRLMVINKHPTANLSAAIDFTGYSPSKTVQTWQYGIAQDHAAETGVGSSDIAHGSILNAGPSTGYSFPPYSITVLVFNKSAGN